MDDVQTVAWRITWHGDSPCRQRVLVSFDQCHEDDGANEPLVLRSDYDALAKRVRELEADSARLDWIKPGFRFLAGDAVQQVMWPDNKGKVTNLANLPLGSGVRALIDAAMQDGALTDERQS